MILSWVNIYFLLIFSNKTWGENLPLKNHTEKFKELKNLVYDYKQNKENEINELNKKLSGIKIQIDQSKENYEKIIDNATDEIESFIKKASPESSIQ